MFVYSFRASTAKFFAVVALALTTLVLLIVFVPTYAATTEDGTVAGEVAYNYTKIKSDADRRSFLAQFGWETAEGVIAECEVTIPSDFDKVFAAYNEIQKEQGFDLSKYKKKTVMRYTYEITNYEGYEGTVYVNLLLYRNRVIGGDICSADVSGFICGLEGK
ncbi:MAG: DUF4830 domain-containing protein [Clostridia bacterium]|nr:DUF4830 domain-containing protein [Clostridia bacterium]MBR2908637.1 DUF4830 domain-containing protein [Clostridia bacterium]